MGEAGARGWSARHTEAARDTIFALSTPLGRSAVAVIRLSGPGSRAALDTLAPPCPKPRTAAYRSLRDPDTGDLVDEGLVLWFPAPASFTGEDCAEFHIHGSAATIAALCAALAKLPGLREARAGEFTQRAFGNGKLDLDRTEALADLIDAQTERQRRLAMQAMGGGIAKLGATWRLAILDSLAEIDARLDFADEGDVDPLSLSPMAVRIDALRVTLDDALHSADRARSTREGFVVAICGPPNSGKSTLLNALVGREQAIVSPFAGTTRDTIEVSLDLGGSLVTLVDTAGLRDTVDPVEAIGIGRARAAAVRADLVLWLEAPDARAEPPSDLAVNLRLFSKGDVLPIAGAAQLSAVSGAGVPSLLDTLAQRAAGTLDGDGSVLRARHVETLRALIGEFAAAAQAVRHDRLEIAAAHLRDALERVAELGSKTADDDVLDRIFGRFCIGK